MKPFHKNSSQGKVIIAGAGPGDPELITLKTLHYLQKADVVITDRLVSPVILNEYTKKEAQILHVGKQCRKRNSTPQSTINELMVEYALQGLLVVRLKGGDVSVFSNILDELETLKSHHIEYEILPGITAALGAAAYAGIPLTARGYSTAVRLLTYYKIDILEEAYWKELASTNDTLVFYMSSDTLDSLITQLIAKGIDGDKQVAIIQQATTSFQNVYSCPIKEYATRWGRSSYASPTLIIIGRVASLHDQFKWVKNNHSMENYFKPLVQPPLLHSRA